MCTPYLNYRIAPKVPLSAISKLCLISESCLILSTAIFHRHKNVTRCHLVALPNTAPDESSAFKISVALRTLI